MFKFSLDALCDHIADDNEISLRIYNSLTAKYIQSLNSYPKDINLIGVYFVDILKLLTHTFLKVKEINLGITPNNEYASKSLNTWPYVSYKDIYSSCNVESKTFGKGSAIEQSQIKLLIQFLVNIQYLFGSKPSSTLSLISPKIDSGPNLLWSQASNIKTNMLNLQSGWFGVPQLDDQIKLLRESIAEIMENHHPLSSKLILDLLERHIRADCHSGNSKIQFKGKILLLSSGVELHNRMLSISALQKEIPVINVMHGEAFGVQDEPICSDFTEFMYSDAILGYGEGFIASASPYKFGIKKTISYIKSNGVKASKYFENEYQKPSLDKKNIKYFYYPTSLSGVSHRYGPYRDTADYLYLKWQESMFSIFGDSIVIKSHPKEKYSKSYSFHNKKLISGSLEDLLNDIDVFIFDYIGTAFHEACSTNKPIVYFDLGIRNIHKDALNVIKDRTIYFDIKDGMPTLSEVKDRLFQEDKENNYSTKYSLCGDDKTRAQSLSEGIQEFF